MRKVVLAVALALAVGTCGGGASEPAGLAPGPSVTLLLAGDVSFARSVGDVVRNDPASIFQDIGSVVRSADIAMANLESPLTYRSSDAAVPLVADPASGVLLGSAGFDLVGVANNHAGDGGAESVLDTLSAVQAAGLAAVGGGATDDVAWEPVLFTVGGVTIGVLAVDATGHAPEAQGSAPGVAVWGERAEASVAALRSEVDVVIVGVHGGSEYLFHPDATIRGIADELASWNVDVVWGHGAHVVQPVTVIDPDGDGRDTVVATSLGNLVFDQLRLGTDRGALLEIIVGHDGVSAFRLGETHIAAGRVGFEGWSPPAGDAALLDGEWWSLVDPPVRVEHNGGDVEGFPGGDVIDAASGDIDGDGAADLVVSFRRPFEDAALHSILPNVQWEDASGRSAHLGVYDPEDFSPRWVAGAIAEPVADVAACDGGVAVKYSTLDDAGIVGLGGWVWNGFGWDEAADLAGTGAIGCSDVDGDGLLDPVVVGRQNRSDDVP